MRTDTVIKKNVIAELLCEPLLSDCKIIVTVKDEIVKLTGTVDAYSKKNAAEEAVNNVLGVKAVEDGIEVRFSESGRRLDHEIAQAVVDAFSCPV